MNTHRTPHNVQPGSRWTNRDGNTFIVDSTTGPNRMNYINTTHEADGSPHEFTAWRFLAFFTEIQSRQTSSARS